MNWVDPEGLFIPQAIGAGIAIATTTIFLYKAYEALQKGQETAQLEKNLYDEYNKGILDPEYAERLKEAADKSYEEFLEELKKTAKEGAACAYSF